MLLLAEEVQPTTSIVGEWLACAAYGGVESLLASAAMDGSPPSTLLGGVRSFTSRRQDRLPL